MQELSKKNFKAIARKGASNRRSCWIRLLAEKKLEIRCDDGFSETIEVSIEPFFITFWHRDRIWEVMDDYQKKIDIDDPVNKNKQIECRCYKEKIYICKTRSNLLEQPDELLNELKKWYEQNKKEEERGVVWAEDSPEASCTVVILDEEEEFYKEFECQGHLYLVTTKAKASFDALTGKLEKECKDGFDVVSHGLLPDKLRDRCREHYDLTTKWEELYQRFKDLKGKLEKPEEFHEEVSQIKKEVKLLRKDLLLKKLRHRLATKVSSLEVGLELYRKGRESASNLYFSLAELFKLLEDSEFSRIIPKDIQEDLKKQEEKFLENMLNLLKEKLLRSLKNIK